MLLWAEACLVPIIATLTANIVTALLYPVFGYLKLCPDFKYAQMVGSLPDGGLPFFLLSLFAIPSAFFSMRSCRRHGVPSICGLLAVSVVLAAMFAVPVILHESGRAR